MLIVSLDNRIVGAVVLVVVAGWILLKVLEGAASLGKDSPDVRPKCNSCGDLLPTGSSKCISCGHQNGPL